MAIAFLQVSIHTRSKGHSAIAASSYRSGMKLYDERTGIAHNYSHRHDVIFSDVLLPNDADAKFLNREFLWNELEKAETRKDAQLCKDVMLALPKELDRPLQIEFAKGFAKTHFAQHGLPVDIAIHDHGDGNPHAHLLIPTRRLEKNRFSKYKARDLNPTFAKRFIVEKDAWGELWRDYQNIFFKERALDISVDLNHIISERHTGHAKNHYLQEENQLIQEVQTELLLNPDAFIASISKTHSVFTKRDIERLVFKTFQKTHRTDEYLNAVANILSHPDIISLGKNQEGFEAYTTRQQYIEEGKLLRHVERLNAKNHHKIDKHLHEMMEAYRLNEEQREAIQFIVKGADISVLIGRPGVGKSYLLKPLKEVYEKENYLVLGASLSGKVAKSLESETGISSSTIASLTYRLQQGTLSLTSKHVLIIDEAGMVDFNQLSYLLKEVDEKGAKIILVGDPDQLKPIQKGEIFRGISAHTGYIELENIRRQKDEGGRQASLALAHGKIEEVVTHYAKKEAIHFNDGSSETTDALIHEWQKNLSASSIKEHVILAFTRAAVSELNIKARTAAIKNRLVKEDSIEYETQNGMLSLSEGERILFRQNNKTLGVRNGDLATITKIHCNQFIAILDSGETVIIPKSHRWIDYGYTLTVHKSQGMTAEKASVFIDSTYWDKHLAFVAMTRHKEKLDIYANTDIHSNLDALTRTLSRTTTKDNVIDWPLDFALRAGFDSEGLIGKAIHYIAKAATMIKDKWNYVVNYEAFLGVPHAKSEMRILARAVASFMDESDEIKRITRKIEREASEKNLHEYQHPEFSKLYLRSIERDKKAASLMSEASESLQKMQTSEPIFERVKNYSDRYNRYQSIEKIAEFCHKPNSALFESKQISNIDLKKDSSHIAYLASKSHLTREALRKKIETLQQEYKKQEWSKLCQEHPLLAAYEKEAKKAHKSQGYYKEIHQKSMKKISESIMKKPDLLNRLKQEYPDVLNAIMAKKTPFVTLDIA